MTRRFRATPYLFLVPALVLIGDLRRLPDRRGHLLQLHRLRHRPAARLDRARQLPASPRRPDVLAGADALVRLPASSPRSSSRSRSGWRSSSTASCAGSTSTGPCTSCPRSAAASRSACRWRWLFERNGFINSILLTPGVIDEADPMADDARSSSCPSRCCSRSGPASATTRSSSWPGSRTSPRSSTTPPGSTAATTSRSTGTSACPGSGRRSSSSP